MMMMRERKEAEGGATVEYMVNIGIEGRGGREREIFLTSFPNAYTHPLLYVTIV